MQTIQWVLDPETGVDGATWAVCDEDESVLDRYETVEEAQKDYPGAFVLR